MGRCWLCQRQPSFFKTFLGPYESYMLDAIISTSLESAKFLPSFLDKPSKIPENRSDLNGYLSISLVFLIWSN